MQRTSWLGLMLLCLSLPWLFPACVALESGGGLLAPAPPPTPLKPVVSAAFLAALEQELADEINLARTQPSTYATFLGRSGRTATINPSGRGRAALSGDRQALEEAVAFLRSTAPLRPLAVSRGMSLGARDHVQEQGRTGAFGHQGGDGTYVDTRVNRYGLWQGQITENLSYGFDNARLMTATLLIDEGIPDRNHRHNMFDAQAQVLGVACGPHPATQIVCVMTFAADYIEGQL